MINYIILTVCFVLINVWETMHCFLTNDYSACYHIAFEPSLVHTVSDNNQSLVKSRRYTHVIRYIARPIKQHICARTVLVTCHSCTSRIPRVFWFVNQRFDYYCWIVRFSWYDTTDSIFLCLHQSKLITVDQSKHICICFLLTLFIHGFA